MRKLVVAAGVCVGLCGAASVANASAPLAVKGTGASAVSGRVIVDARATGPATGSPAVAPAVGSFGVTDSFWGDVSGSVTCIGFLFDEAVVSGNLDTPVVSGGYSYANFTLVMGASAGGPHAGWIHLFVDNLPLGTASCGESLFFAVGVPDVPTDAVVDGHFRIGGA